MIKLNSIVLLSFFISVHSLACSPRIIPPCDKQARIVKVDKEKLQMLVKKTALLYQLQTRGQKKPKPTGPFNTCYGIDLRSHTLGSFKRSLPSDYRTCPHAWNAVVDLYKGMESSSNSAPEIIQVQNDIKNLLKEKQ